MNKNDLKNKYTNALNEFVNEEKLNKNILGIFVSGSYVLNKLNENSDIDIFIVTKDKYTQVLAKYYDDIEFECCYKPLEQFFYDIEIIKSAYDVQRYYNSEILYDTDNQLIKIKEKATEIFKNGPNTYITDADKYHLIDKINDVSDYQHEIEFELLLYQSFLEIIRIFFKKNNLWPCKEKYYIEYISNYDELFAIKVKQFLSADNRQTKYKYLHSLKNLLLSDTKPLDKNWSSPRVMAPVFADKK